MNVLPEGNEPLNAIVPCRVAELLGFCGYEYATCHVDAPLPLLVPVNVRNELLEALQLPVQPFGEPVT